MPVPASHSDTAQHDVDGNASRGRIHLLDTIRGFTIVSMVAFHTVYDLVYLYGINLPWFLDFTIQELWRISISWVFIALAGWMTALSRNNVRRACRYSAAALIIWVATSLAAVDTPISFGILFCMAASTWIWVVLNRLMPNILERHYAIMTALLLIGFIVLYPIPRHTYAMPGLAWLGFPTAAFMSGDYYPLIPFGLLYLAFAVLANYEKKVGFVYPAWAYRDWCPPLSWIGTKSLPIYLVHQVAIMAILQLMLG